MATFNRLAILVKPKQPFLSWLHTADPTGRSLTLQDLREESTIYLIPEVTRTLRSTKSCAAV